MVVVALPPASGPISTLLGHELALAELWRALLLGRDPAQRSPGPGWTSSRRCDRAAGFRGARHVFWVVGQARAAAIGHYEAVAVVPKILVNSRVSESDPPLTCHGPGRAVVLSRVIRLHLWAGRDQGQGLLARGGKPRPTSC